MDARFQAVPRVCPTRSLRYPLGAKARHVPEVGVGVALAGGGERGEGVGAPWCDLSERVDRGGAQICVRVAAKELQSPRHEQIVTRPAIILLACVTRQRVECPGADRGIVVVERGNEVGDGLLVDELIKDGHTEAPDDGFRMPEPAAQRRQRGRSRSQKMPSGLLA